MSFDFYDLRKEVQEEFVAKNFAEILYRQRKADGISQQRFINKYFLSPGAKSLSLSLSQLKRYEKEFLQNDFTTKPQKNGKAIQLVLEKMMDIVRTIYREKMYVKLLKEDSQLLGDHLQGLGLLDCIDKAAGGLYAMYDLNKHIGRRYSKDELLEWLFVNAKRALHGEPIGELEYEDRLTRHDVYSEANDNNIKRDFG